jgi:hypothetical protein
MHRTGTAALAAAAAQRGQEMEMIEDGLERQLLTHMGAIDPARGSSIACAL